MITFKVEDKDSIGKFLPLFRDGITEWYGSTESMINGYHLMTLDESFHFFADGISRGDLLLIGFYEDGALFGYGIEKPEDGFAQGVHMYASPEMRGLTFFKYSDWLVDQFGEFRFCSTLPGMNRMASLAGYEKTGEIVQDDGTLVMFWRKA